MTALGGFAVQRTWAGGELYRLTQKQALTLLQAPFMGASSHPSPQPVVATPTPDDLSAFTENKKGQFGFDFCTVRIRSLLSGNELVGTMSYR